MFSTTFDRISTTVSGKIDEVGAQIMGGQRSTGLVVAAAACAILPLEISHLLSMIAGILAYMLFQSLRPTVEPSRSSRVAEAALIKPQHPWNARAQAHRVGSPAESRAAIGASPASRSGTRPPVPRSSNAAGAATPRADVRKPSAMPVQAPTFESKGWEAEVRELLSRIAPSAAGDALVERIVRAVQRVIAPIFPEAEVSGFACGNVTSGTAFGVAVPEVDIVINVSPTVLLGRLQGRWRTHGAERLDAQKLRKSAIRACTDRLVGTGIFKFRRSAFRGPEPKVTIVTPSFDASGQGVPFNLSVNALTPLYNAALLTECGRLAPRAKELVLLVRRWAKDRGLCHTAKGHLSPYAWTLLVIFFCQVSCDSDEETPLLPSLEGFSTCSGLMNDSSRTGAPKAPAPNPKAADARKCGAKSAGALFKAFVAFYAKDFDWRKEAVSVRFGRRAAPDQNLPLHIVLDGDSDASQVGPSIEDPFEPTQNLGACTTATSLAHLWAELQRAEGLCTAGASLSVLLEPWAPPEVACGQGAEEQEQDEN